MTKKNLMYEKKNELDGDSPLIFTAVGVQLIELMFPSVEKSTMNQFIVIWEL